MKKYVDLLIDILLYTIISLLYLSAGYYIIEGIFTEPKLITIASLLGMGIILSLFLFWLKSWSGE